MRYITQKKYLYIFAYPLFINFLSAYSLGCALDSMIYGNSWEHYLEKFKSHFIFTPNHSIAGIIPATLIFMLLIFADFNSPERSWSGFFSRLIFSLAPAFMFFISAGSQASFDSWKGIWDKFNYISATVGIVSFIACAFIVIKLFDYQGEQNHVIQQQPQPN